MASSTAIITQELANKAGIPISSISPNTNNTLGAGIADAVSNKMESVIKGSQIVVSPGQLAQMQEAKDELANKLAKSKEQSDAARAIVQSTADMINAQSAGQNTTPAQRASTLAAATAVVTNVLNAIDDVPANAFGGSSDLPKNKTTLSDLTNALNTTPQPSQSSQSQQEQDKQKQVEQNNVSISAGG